jgi:hypothetical protein
MNLRESVIRVLEGTAILVFAAILIGAGSIVWTASVSYQDEMDLRVEAITEVFSSELAEVSSEVRRLRFGNVF